MQPQSKKAGTRSRTTKKTEKNRVTVPAVASNASPRQDLAEAQAPDASPRAQLSPDLQSIIAARAYELYQKRGGRIGHELDDWLEAEREVLGHYD
jgi:hypothetical protein